MAGRKTDKLILVNGSRIRATRLDACGRVVFGDNNVVITKGWASVAITTNTTSTDAVTVKNADGETLVNVPEKTSFSNLGVEISLIEVDPELFALFTGNTVRHDANGVVTGVNIDSKTDLNGQGVALEVWAGAPAGDACSDDAAEGSYGYALLPFLQGGILGDHTFAEGAISFTMTGLVSKDGNSWGVGPYDVEIGADGNPAPLFEPLTSSNHEVLEIVGLTPPDAYDGARPQLDPSATAVTGITDAAATGSPPAHTRTFTATGATSGSQVWWEFGDDEWDYVTGPTITHTFPAAGTYTVTASTNGTWVSHLVTIS
jgi:hypothetical protein